MPYSVVRNGRRWNVARQSAKQFHNSNLRHPNESEIFCHFTRRQVSIQNRILRNERKNHDRRRQVDHNRKIKFETVKYCEIASFTWKTKHKSHHSNHGFSSSLCNLLCLSHRNDKCHSATLEAFFPLFSPSHFAIEAVLLFRLLPNDLCDWIRQFFDDDDDEENYSQNDEMIPFKLRAMSSSLLSQCIGNNKQNRMKEWKKGKILIQNWNKMKSLCFGSFLIANDCDWIIRCLIIETESKRPTRKHLFAKS